MLLKKYSDFLVFLSLATLTFFIYLLTLSRSVYPGDSGEFIALAKTLGIAHPPGYPLYTMLSHLFAYLPLENIAFKVNFFSAVASSLTIGVVYLTVLRLSKSRLISIASSLTLAFSYLFWLYSLVAEVFSLHGFFLSLILFFTVSFYQEPERKKHLYLLFLSLGLASTNHHTIIFVFPSILLLLIFKRKSLSLKLLFFGLSFFLLGLTPYVYLPIRASQNPILNWGDPSNFERFTDVVLRKDYGTFSLYSGKKSAVSLDPVIFYFENLSKNSVFIGIVAGVPGIVYLIKKGSRLSIILFSSFLLLGPFFAFLTGKPSYKILNNSTIERFFIASQIFWAVFFSFGLMWFSEKFSRYKRYFALILIIPFLLVIVNYKKVDQKNNFAYEEYGKLLFSSLPYNSVIFTYTDEVSMLGKYFQEARGERKDIKVIMFTFLSDNWYQDSLKQRYPDFDFPYEYYSGKSLTEIEAVKVICEKVAGKYPAFVENQTIGFSSLGNPECSFNPFFLVTKISNPKEEISLENLDKQRSEFWEKEVGKILKINHYDLKSKLVKNFYADSLSDLGERYWSLKAKDKTGWAYETAYKISPTNVPAIHFLALRAIDRMDFDKAIEMENKALDLQPSLYSAYRVLGNIYLYNKNQKWKAYSYYKKFLEYAPLAKDKAVVEKIMDEIIQTR